MNAGQLKWINLFGFVLVLALNYAANALPLNGMTTGELSEFYPNRFVPAGFTFAIWGLIYALLLGFIIVNFVPAYAKLVEKIQLWFFYSCVANAGWIYLWHHKLVLPSLLVMLVILGCLIKVYKSQKLPFRPLFGLESLTFSIPFSIYLGWISVATIANMTALLVSLGWTGGGFQPEQWASIMIVIASMLGVYFVRFRSDFAYAAVLIWALVGVYVGQEPFGATMNWSIRLGILAIILSSFSSFLRTRSLR